MLTVGSLTDIQLGAWPGQALSGWQQWLGLEPGGKGLGSTHSGRQQGLPQLLVMLCYLLTLSHFPSH